VIGTYRAQGAASRRERSGGRVVELVVSAAEEASVHSWRFSGGSDWFVVQFDRRRLRRRVVEWLDGIGSQRIGSQRVGELLLFDNVSLWQFVPELCYLHTAKPLREVVELIEAIGPVLAEHRPAVLRVDGVDGAHRRNVLEQLGAMYGVRIDFGDTIAGRSVPTEAPNQASEAGPVNRPVDRPADSAQDAVRRGVEEGNAFAIQAWARRVRPIEQRVGGPGAALLVSMPTAWEAEGGSEPIDRYFHWFGPILADRGLQPVRVEPPYYQFVRGSRAEYVAQVLSGPRDGMETVLLDEFYEPAFYAQAQEVYEPALAERFAYLAGRAEFRGALSWNGVDLLGPLAGFWRRVFVTHLATRCIPAMLTARRMIARLRPRLVMAVYEAGLFARAILIEAHRVGVPTVAVQHGTIHPEHDYYLHRDVCPEPDLSRPCAGVIVARRTVLFGTYFEDVLRGNGTYPAGSTCVLGRDWRAFETAVDPEVTAGLRRQWFGGTEKGVVLLLTRPRMEDAQVEQIAARVDPARQVVVVKLHPGDRREAMYERVFGRRGIAVHVTREHLAESLAMADVVVATAMTTVNADALAAGKRVYVYGPYDSGYTVPWEGFVTRIEEVERFDTGAGAGGVGGRPAGVNESALGELLAGIGWDRRIGAAECRRRFERMLDELGVGRRRDHAKSASVRSGATAGPAKTTRSTKAAGSAKPAGPRAFENGLYRQLEVHYENFFRAEPLPPVDDGRPLIEHVRRISFQLSNRCNYAHCHKKCPVHYETAPVILPGRVVRKTLDELGGIDFDGVVAFHIYNEPLNDPRLFSFIEYARARCPRCRVLILTNGWYLTQTLADELAELGVWNLVVSAYSDGEFDRLSRLDVKVPYRVFRAFLDDRRSIYEREPIPCDKPCGAPVVDVSVAPSGHVVLCCLDYEGRHRFGDLKAECLQDILEKPQCRQVYAALRAGRRRLYLCRRCDWSR